MEIIGTFWALIPPIVAIALALVSRETYTSLFVGILVGAILLAVAAGDPVDTMNFIISGQVFSPEAYLDGTAPTLVAPAEIPAEYADVDVINVGLINALSGSAGIFVSSAGTSMVSSYVSSYSSDNTASARVFWAHSTT